MPHIDRRRIEVTTSRLTNVNVAVFEAINFFIGLAGQLNVMTEDESTGTRTLVTFSPFFWDKIEHKYIR